MIQVNILIAHGSFRCKPARVSALSALDGSVVDYRGLTGNGELGSIPEREPEKRLPHLRMAAGAQIAQSQHIAEAAKRNSEFMWHCYVNIAMEDI